MTRKQHIRTELSALAKYVETLISCTQSHRVRAPRLHIEAVKLQRRIARLRRALRRV